MRRRTPAYELAEMLSLARGGRVLLTKHVTAWLDNHGYDASDFVLRLLKHLPTDGRWLGSCVLANSVGADEYTVVVNGVEWYLKFYLDESRRVVIVWSCWWQGSAH